MRMRLLGTRGSIVAVTLAVIGTGAHVASADQVVTAEGIRDPDLGFTLLRPGPGWRLVAEDEQPFTYGEVRAGAFHGDQGLVGCVFVMPALAEPLGETLRRAVDRLPARGYRLVDRRPTALAGLEGILLESDETRQPNEARLGWDVWVPRGNELFHVRVTGPPGRPADERKSMQVFLDAVSLSRRSGPGRALRRDAHDGEGAGWTLRSNVYTDAARGFRIRAPEGWVLETAVAEGSSSWDVRMTRRKPAGADLVVRALHVRGDATAVRVALRAAMVSHLGLGPMSGVIDTNLGGSPLRLERWIRETSGVETLYGCATHGDALVQILLGRRLGAGDQDERSLEALAAWEWLSAEHAARERSVALARQAQDADFGRGWTLRSGLFVDWVAGVTWRLPEDIWSFQGPMPGRSAPFRAIGLLSGLDVTTVSVRNLPDAKAVQAFALRSVADHWWLEGRQERVVEAGEDRAAVVDLTSIEPPRRLSTIATYFRDPLGMGLMLAGFEGNFHAAAAMRHAAVAGLRLHGAELPPIVERKGRTWIDRRAGFALELPLEEAWTFRDVDFDPEDAGAAARRGEKEGVVVLASRFAGGLLPTRQRASWCEQAIADDLRGFERVASPAEAPWHVSGREATHHVWRLDDQEAHAFVLTRGHVGYAIVVSTQAGHGDRETLLRRLASVTWLD